MSKKENLDISNFLCDTWWYGLTSRISDKEFEMLAKLRAKQGFSAVQLVVGIPPEVGAENQNAKSEVGSAWNLNGEINYKYLDFAKEKIQLLNRVGLSVIVYGAWGHQIEWLGVEGMKKWWGKIISTLDKLDVMYCLTGESDIWVGEEKKLLPDKTTKDFNTTRFGKSAHSRLLYIGKRIIDKITGALREIKLGNRRKKWSEVLDFVSKKTKKPIIIHTIPHVTSEEVVNNPAMLGAVTVQTGHGEDTRNLLWKLPFENTQKYKKPFINLEPWYEGINNNFGIGDQMSAYWASMMAGADAYCYGAHGIWNAGDGVFLSHWGKQTFQEAVKLETPKLLGKSHKLFNKLKIQNYEFVKVDEKDGELFQITRNNKNGNSVSYIPEVSFVENLPDGKIFLPVTGKFVTKIPKFGSIVVII